jgi:hypothetical protein
LTFLKPQFDELKAGLAPLLATEAAGVMYPLTVPVLAGSILLTYIVGLGVKQPGNPPDVLGALQRTLDGVTALVADAVALEEQAATDLPTVEQLLCECLDTTVHRADAWATSLATARLRRTRDEQPTGLRTGAYGWVAELHPLEPGQRTAGDGYIVAPSLHHATTAAVLRSGWLAHSDRRAFAVNVTSARVRRALSLLDGAHAGQPLAALLGYRFERGLHDAQLDRLIAPFRARYPLAPLVDPAAPGAGEAQAAIAARNVVDGEALRRDRAAFDGAAPPVAVGDPAALATARALIAELDDVIDSVGDLLLAECVHHLVGGNALRAGLAADAIGRGDGVPPEFEVITTPRSAVTVTFATGVLTPPPGGPDQGWSGDRALATLEPALERWCRARLGAAGGWRFDRADGGGAVTLEGVSALEVVRSAPPALLHRLVGTVGLADTGRFEELAALAGALRATLAVAAPLLASHLDPTADGWATADLDELASRVGTWLDGVGVHVGALRAARGALANNPADAQAADDLSTALDWLAGAGLDIGAGSPDDADRLLAAVEAAALPAALPPPPSGTDRNATSTLAWTTAITGMVRSLVGDGMLLVPVLRLVADPVAATLAAANRPAGADDDAVADWLRDLGRVRPATGALRDALLGAEVMAGAAPPRFVVAQAPPAADAPWVAVTAGPGRSCCVLAADGDAAPGLVAGFVVDTWSETIPRAGRQPDSPEEVAAIAFHAPRPDARPPQALLLAVPPDPTRGWRMEDVHAAVEETFDLARIRTLDLVDLPELRGPLPPDGPVLPSLNDLP